MKKGGGNPPPIAKTRLAVIAIELKPSRVDFSKALEYSALLIAGGKGAFLGGLCRKLSVLFQEALRI